MLASIMSLPLNKYFVPGFGISRAVIQSEIRYHCGPEAIVRPYTLQVGCVSEAYVELVHADRECRVATVS